MKLQILSDLHLEGGKYHEFIGFDVEEGVDALVLSGDITSWKRRWLVDIFKDVKVPVLYVLGNHEFYGGPGYDEALEMYHHMNKKKEWGENVKLLDNTYVDIKGVRIIGSTLWSEPIHNPNGMPWSMFIADFGGANLHFTPEKCRNLHYQAKAMIRNGIKMAREEGMKSVVITHFAPSFKAQDPIFDKSAISSFFCTDMEDLISLEEPDLWIYGHTHSNIDFQIGSTRVVTNQRGYTRHKDEPYSRPFSMKYVVEV